MNDLHVDGAVILQGPTWNVALRTLVLCPCGYPMLEDHVPLGTVYKIAPRATIMGTIKCGGCGETHAEVEMVAVGPRVPGQRWGLMPLALFDTPLCPEPS